MFGHATRVLGAVALLAGLSLIPSSDLGAANHFAHMGTVRIGMIATLFSDVPQPIVMAMMQPFAALMESQTGVNGELVACGDADNLGQQLTDDKVQLGVFHGIEFAWARQKHPELRPLMIAVNQHRYLQGLLVVRADSKVGNFGDLEKKTLAFSNQTREHCQLFLRRHCLEAKKEPANFFCKINNPANVEDALDDVVDGVVQATVVDGVALECYKRRQPGRFTKLKILLSSELFPAAVVAFRPGILDDDVLKRFREGMINANRSVVGRQLMTLWKLTGFEDIPADYDKVLTEIVKAYPAPTPSSRATAP